MTSALSAALKKPALDQGASSALADSLKAPQKAATSGGFDLSTIPLPPTAFPGLYHDSSTGEDYVADLDNLALSTSIGTQFSGSYKSRVGTPIADFEPNSRKLRGHERIPAIYESEEDRRRWEGMGRPSISANFFSPSMYGSLPKALSHEERLSISRNTPASASLREVQQRTPAKVSAPTRAGRALRRSLLKGCVVVIVVAGYSGKRFVYERAHELGIRLVIIDGPDSWAKELVDDKIVEKFYGIDFTDESTIFDRCLAKIKEAESALGQLDGVCSFWEAAQSLVASLAERLGLHSHTPEAVEAAREKQNTRSCMKRAGLPTPANHLIRSTADVSKAAEVVGFPAVIKPISGAASEGVVRVDSLEQLERVYERERKKIKAKAIDSNTTALDEGRAEEERHKGRAELTFMMEQYLDGPEVDVDVVLNSEGDVAYGNVTDNWPTIEPYFNETGSNCPSILPMHQQRELCQLSVAAVKCMGFTVGVFHVECKYTSQNGPQLIEVNARMGGGPVYAMNNFVWGIDLVEEQFLGSCGIPSRPYMAKKPVKCIAEFSVNAQKTGTLKNVDWVDKFQGDPKIVYCRALQEKGAHVTSVEDGLPTWVAEVMVWDANVNKAISHVLEIEKDLQANMKIE
ncbi:g6793 [Coccomyxa viridis]|uniref:G6793 protein n=1 Tax=Coccomyxa viridis TaxID=1274662 RepID=A0ABP1FXH2_9CHLO